MIPRSRISFSLIELVIVIAILAILASIAVPRFSSASGNAGKEAAAADLRVLNSALLRYAAEHQGRYPGPTAERMQRQLTEYSDLAGNPGPDTTSGRRFGPYLRAFPPCPTGPNEGSTKVRITLTSPLPDEFQDGSGWVYNPTTGEIGLNFGNPVGPVSVSPGG